MFNTLLSSFCLCADTICNYFPFVLYTCTLRTVMLSLFLDVRGDADLSSASTRTGKLIILDFYKKSCVHCIIGSQENEVRDFDTLLKYLTTKILASADSHILHCPWTCLATAALVQSWSGNSGPLKFKGVKLTNLKFLKIIQKQIIFYKKLPKHKFW